MEISSVSAGLAAAKAAESSVLMARKVLEAQKLEGQAAVNLIQRSATVPSAGAGAIIDIYA